MPTKTWVVGEEVLAADFNTFVQRQVVATFANAAARDAAIPSPTEGMMAYLDDLNALQLRLDTLWKTLPAGYLAEAKLTANSGSAAQTPLVVPGLSISITVPAGRRIRLSFSGQMVHSGTGTLARVYIQEGATVLTQAYYSLGGNNFVHAHFVALIQPAAGSHTYDIYMSSDVNTINVNANPQQPAWHWAEDLGA